MVKYGFLFACTEYGPVMIPKYHANASIPFQNNLHERECAFLTKEEDYWKLNNGANRSINVETDGYDHEYIYNRHFRPHNWSWENYVLYCKEEEQLYSQYVRNKERYGRKEYYREYYLHRIVERIVDIMWLRLRIKSVLHIKCILHMLME